jgi:hypothetical protein
MGGERLSRKTDRVGVGGNGLIDQEEGPCE